MADYTSQAVDLSTLPPPVVSGSDAESGAMTVKDAHHALDAAFAGYRSRLDASRKALAKAEKHYASRVQKARRDRQQAAVPAKIATIGVIQRVTLTETAIKTPKGLFELTPDVTARAEQHGNKQVVQGWVFKSDNDRREVYLHLNGPDWGVVLPFSMKHAIAEPRDLHDFATKVGVAARGVDQARASIDARCRAADRQLATALADNGAVIEAVDALVVATWDVAQLKPAREAAEALLANADPSDRKVRRAIDSVASVRRQVESAAADTTEAHRRATEQAAAGRSEVERITSGLAAPAPAPAPAPAAASSGPAAAVAVPESDVLEQIRKLGDLRDAGLVTPEEFEAKKADLLSRL